MPIPPGIPQAGAFTEPIPYVGCLASVSNPISDNWTVLCDFDGTIVPLDITDALLEAFAAPEWRSLEQQWVDGHITAHQCMEQQVRLLQVDIDTLNRFLDDVPLTPGMTEFVRWCRDQDLYLHVVSDGLDYAIQRILKNHGLGDIPVTANKLCFDSGHYHLEFPYGRQDCPSGVCKCACAAEMAGNDGAVLLIGDGLSDCCVATKADFVLAKAGQALHRQCQDRNFPHRTYENFYDVRSILDTTKLLTGAAPVHEACPLLFPEGKSSHVH